jgi:hypothetical protein
MFMFYCSIKGLTEKNQESYLFLGMRKIEPKSYSTLVTFEVIGKLLARSRLFFSFSSMTTYN